MRHTPQPHRRLSKKLSFLAMGATAAVLASCQQLRPFNDVTSSGTVHDPQIPQQVTGEGGEGVTKLPLPFDGLPQSTAKTDPLPTGPRVPRIDFQNTPVWLALQAITKDRGITLTRSGDIDDRVVSAEGSDLSFPDAISVICGSGDVYCHYTKTGGRGGRIDVSPSDTFSVSLPPVQQTEDQVYLIDSLTNLTGEAPVLDPTSRLLTYRANTKQQEKVEGYLKELDANRTEIVFESYIWEVTFDDSKKTGINWSKLTGNIGKLQLTSTGAPVTIPMPGGISLGTIFSSANFSINALANFLQTQGTTKNISQPRTTLVNGSTAEFNVGGKQYFVKSIGQITNTGTTTNLASQNTVETDVLETGLKVKITGSYHDSTVFATLGIDINTLVSFDTFPAGPLNATLSLPKTATRHASQFARIRPGDILLLAGLNQTQDSRTEEGLPIFSHSLMTGTDTTTTHSELVIAMIPRVVVYETPAETAARMASSAPMTAITPSGQAIPFKPVAQ